MMMMMMMMMMVMMMMMMIFEVVFLGITTKNDLDKGMRNIKC